MFTLLFFIPAAVLFTAINIILGCYIAIRLGYGPPNWQTSLNQAVRLTILQDWLNAGRGWLEKKAPKVDQFLTRVHVPKPIVIIDTTYVEEDEDEDEIMAVEGSNNEVPEEADKEELGEYPGTENAPQESETEEQKS